MAYNDAYNFPKIYHMISVSNKEIEGKIFNMINRNGFTPENPISPSLTPNLYVDWVTKTLRDRDNRTHVLR
jgi:phosphoribulokinase